MGKVPLLSHEATILGGQKNEKGFNLRFVLDPNLRPNFFGLPLFLKSVEETMKTQREQKLSNIIQNLGEMIHKRGWFLPSDLLQCPGLSITRTQYLSRLLAKQLGFAEFKIASPETPFGYIFFARNRGVVVDFLLNSISEVKNAE